MYTGVVETTGTVRRTDRLDSGCRIEVTTDTEGLEPEDSIGISGVCLTVEAVGDGWFRTFLSAETVDRTYLAALDSGTAVNVERPMAVADRFDGHLVKGTVDATTEVVASRPRRGLAVHRRYSRRVRAVPRGEGGRRTGRRESDRL